VRKKLTRRCFPLIVRILTGFRWPPNIVKRAVNDPRWSVRALASTLEPDFILTASLRPKPLPCIVTTVPPPPEAGVIVTLPPASAASVVKTGKRTRAASGIQSRARVIALCE
jgi:hypothetical protein